MLSMLLFAVAEVPPSEGNPFVQIAREVGPWLLGPGVLAIVLWYLKDRRKDRAVSQVAEETVDDEIRLKAIGTDQALVAYMEMAFAAERASKDRVIADQDKKIEAQELEIEELRSDVQQQRAMIRRLNQKCDNLAAELSRLTGKAVEEC